MFTVAKFRFSEAHAQNPTRGENTNKPEKGRESDPEELREMTR